VERVRAAIVGVRGVGADPMIKILKYKQKMRAVGVIGTGPEGESLAPAVRPAP
jgi:acetaldehyde dehydrogenase (acetylating)